MQYMLFKLIIFAIPSSVRALLHDTVAVELPQQEPYPRLVRMLRATKMEPTWGHWGTTTEDMQEAGVRFLNGAARWTFRRLAWPAEIPPYMFDPFTLYVKSFADFWIEAKLTPTCDKAMENLKSVVTKARDDLANANDGKVELPKIEGDNNLEKLMASLKHPDKYGGFGMDPRTEQGPNCQQLSASLQKRFCAPSKLGPDADGWRFWFDEWFPALIEALSCGSEDDAVAKSTWEWVKAGGQERYKVVDAQWVSDVSKHKISNEDLSYKAWRLVYRYILDSELFTYEMPSQYAHRELARFMPFVGEALDNNFETSCKPDMSKDDAGDCGPQIYQLLNMQATERQPFYGPWVWRFFHSVPEFGLDQTALGKFAEFVSRFRLNHPCPHCRKHLNTKVQHSDVRSIDPEKLLEDHEFRNWEDNTYLFQESDEVLMYPLEWMTIIDQASGHVLGSSAASWSDLLGAERRDADISDHVDLLTKLEHVKSFTDLRVFFLKMHNAVDSTIESKHEERCRPWPMSYYPVSSRYRATEPWGEPDVDTRAGRWAEFRVRLADNCGLDEPGKFASTIYSVKIDDARRQIVDEGHLNELKKLGWRATWIVFVHVLHLGRTTTALRNELLSDQATAEKAIKARIVVKGEDRVNDEVVGTVKTTAARDALAYWLSDFQRWSFLLGELENDIECVMKYIVESKLLQKKYGKV